MDFESEREPEESTTERVALVRRGDEVVLDADGLRIRSSRRSRGRTSLPYRDITHFVAARNGLWIGTKSRIMAFRRNQFLDPQGPEQLSQALTRAIGRQPYGLEQLARISQLHGIGRRPFPQRVTRLVSLVCVVVYIAQLRDPFIQEVSAMIPSLVAAGQPWRLVSANFLHGISTVPIHLIFNLLGLLGLALLVERPLGAVRTGIIMGISGIGAMLSSYVVGANEVIGASGIVLGLAGAALCLELHHCDRLPVLWRIPRGPFIALLIIEGVMGFVLPFVAGEAHLGGFAAGYLATRVIGEGGVLRLPATGWIRSFAWATAAVTALALINVVFLTMRESDALERYAHQQLSTQVGPGVDNALAWRMATESDADVEQLESAQTLAERAATETGYQDPEILDTLAEVLFIRGDRDGALQLIDEAIRITHGENYYLQQRRRFTGDRDFDDRPAPPPPWAQRRRAAEFYDVPEGMVI